MKSVNQRSAEVFPAKQGRELSETQFRHLGEFRYLLRRFLHFSQDAAERCGVRPQQYQLLLAVRGIPEGTEPTIANVASRLLLKHNSAVELVDRTIELGLLRRVTDPEDHRRILLRVTAEGERLLASLAEFHLAELEEAGPELMRALRRLGSAREPLEVERRPAGERGRR